MLSTWKILCLWSGFIWEIIWSVENWCAKLKKWRQWWRLLTVLQMISFMPPYFYQQNSRTSQLYFNLGHDHCMRIEHIIYSRGRFISKIHFFFVFLVLSSWLFSNDQGGPVHFKGAQVWDFRPIFFYISKSYMGRWLEDWRKKNFCSKTKADIRHFGFFAHAEPALKNCKRMLSLR